MRAKKLREAFEQTLDWRRIGVVTTDAFAFHAPDEFKLYVTKHFSQKLKAPTAVVNVDFGDADVRKGVATVLEILLALTKDRPGWFAQVRRVVLDVPARMASIVRRLLRTALPRQVTFDEYVGPKTNLFDVAIGTLRFGRSSHKLGVADDVEFSDAEVTDMVFSTAAREDLLQHPVLQAYTASVLEQLAEVSSNFTWYEYTHDDDDECPRGVLEALKEEHESNDSTLRDVLSAALETSPITVSEYDADSRLDDSLDGEMESLHGQTELDSDDVLSLIKTIKSVNYDVLVDGVAEDDADDAELRQNAVLEVLAAAREWRKTFKALRDTDGVCERHDEVEAAGETVRSLLGDAYLHAKNGRWDKSSEAFRQADSLSSDHGDGIDSDIRERLDGLADFDYLDDELRFEVARDFYVPKIANEALSGLADSRRRALFDLRELDKAGDDGRGDTTARFKLISQELDRSARGTPYVDDRPVPRLELSRGSRDTPYVDDRPVPRLELDRGGANLPAIQTSAPDERRPDPRLFGDLRGAIPRSRLR